MDLYWIYIGYIMDMYWILVYQGYIMDISWIYNADIMDNNLGNHPLLWPKNDYSNL